MSRPRKRADQLHCCDLKIWITERQDALLSAVAEKRDMPKGVLAREMLMRGLDKLKAEGVDSG